MTALDTYLRSRSDRCDHCGSHVPTQGHGGECGKTDEWTLFVAAVKAVAVEGVVHQSAMRPKLRGRIAPKRIGLAYKRAVREGLLTPMEPERSDDEIGKNAGRWEPCYKLGGAA